MRRLLPLVALALLGLAGPPAAWGVEAPPGKVVLLAGAKSHGPGDHEYEKGLRVLAAGLDQLGVPNEVHTDGWPKDDSAFEGAATIVLFSDGPDRDPNAHPILRGNRLETLDRLMKRGVGLVAIHYAVFVPSDRPGDRFLEWLGGYFDYQTGTAANHWYSKIQNVAARCELPNPGHPVARGLTPFDLKEEYYYNIRFRDNDARLTPILTAAVPGESPAPVVAWAVQRSDGGRGFGYTGGHYHANWSVDNVRKLVLNGILWTARIEVPEAGAETTIDGDAFFIGDSKTGPTASAGPDAIDALIITGPQHPAHDWRATTQALQEVLAKDDRFRVRVAEAFEAIGSKSLGAYHLIVLNTENWQRPGPGEALREQFAATVRDGKGLGVIHFANGAFPDSAPFHQLVRRYWLEGTSGHDAFGPFQVAIRDHEHPITKGLNEFATTDELYFKQQGDAPIHVLATARSRATVKDEPMAFTYEVGKGRVFQTVLGHDANAIRNQGTAELLRRGLAWAAGREPRTIDPPNVP